MAKKVRLRYTVDRNYRGESPRAAARRRGGPIRRTRFREPVQPEFDHRINHRIRISPIRVIDENGEQLGVVETHVAQALATERGLDLVEVAPNVRPPVCRIMSYGQFRYEQQKRKKAQAKNAAPELKVVQVRPKTDRHDLETKLGHARSFLEKGHRVRLVMRMRGRENAYGDRWVEHLREIAQSLKDVGEVIGAPSAEGRAIALTLQPAGAKSVRQA